MHVEFFFSIYPDIFRRTQTISKDMLDLLFYDKYSLLFIYFYLNHTVDIKFHIQKYPNDE